MVPWADLVATIEPVCPQADGPERPPVGIERMLRLYCLQQWFNLSDSAVGEALYDSCAMRQFMGIDVGREPVPNETTICKFRHRLEAHQLGEQLFARIGEHLVTVSRSAMGQSALPGASQENPPARDQLGLANLCMVRRRLLAEAS